MARISILCHEYACVAELGFIDLDDVSDDALKALAQAAGGEVTRDSLNDLVESDDFSALMPTMQTFAQRILRVLSHYHCEACAENLPTEEVE